MSNANWQMLVVLLVVAAAVIVLGRRVFHFVRGKSTGSCGTGGCGSCSTNPTTSGVIERPLVQLGGAQTLTERATSRRSKGA